MLILQHTARIRGAALLCCLLNASVWAACEGWYHSPGWCTDPKTGLMYQEGSAPPVSQSPEERAAAQRAAYDRQKALWQQKDFADRQREWWGAFAIDVKDGKTARVVNNISDKDTENQGLLSSLLTKTRSPKQRAEDEAMEACKQDGGTDCRVYSYKNTCIAILAAYPANDKGLPVFTASFAPSKKEALDHAMQRCKALEGASCQLWGYLSCSGYGWDNRNMYSKEPNEPLEYFFD